MCIEILGEKTFDNFLWKISSTSLLCEYILMECWNRNFSFLQFNMIYFWRNQSHIHSLRNLIFSLSNIFYYWNVRNIRYVLWVRESVSTNRFEWTLEAETDIVNSVIAFQWNLNSEFRRLRHSVAHCNSFNQKVIWWCHVFACWTFNEL